MTDNNEQPKRKLRKHPLLWQSYLYWDELMQMRKRHLLRLSSIEADRSGMDESFETDIIAVLCPMLKLAQQDMAAHGKNLGVVWDWMTSIKGIGDHTAAKILALFDDVENFATISKFWRFSGWAVIDGEIDRCRKGEKSPYNRRLKSECFIIAQNFIRQQTPVYVDIYYAEKARLRRLYPEPVKADNGPWPMKYTDSHVHRMALRKMIKIFLSHLWQVWRETDGLPVSEPWVSTIGGHTNIVPIPNWK